MLVIPLNEQGRFNGAVVAEYSIDGLLRFGVPPEVMARYAVALLDEQQARLGPETLDRAWFRYLRMALSATPKAARPATP